MVTIASQVTVSPRRNNEQEASASTQRTRNRQNLKFAEDGERMSTLRPVVPWDCRDEHGQYWIRLGQETPQPKGRRTHPFCERVNGGGASIELLPNGIGEKCDFMMYSGFLLGRRTHPGAERVDVRVTSVEALPNDIGNKIASTKLDGEL
ncbi:hypothetical protein K438DRAFT_1774933 [Mycena galopus ATCC 62051]|nr:hypothetical protein K438DRAFT_1774933 [Mycena galopus ATCC 62051]